MKSQTNDDGLFKKNTRVLAEEIETKESPSLAMLQ
jgi:hypothetical protein